MDNVKNIIQHLREHQQYPATRNQLVEECNHLSDFSKKDKQWFMETLPEGTYRSADEVIKALDLDEQTGME